MQPSYTLILARLRGRRFRAPCRQPPRPMQPARLPSDRDPCHLWRVIRKPCRRRAPCPSPREALKSDSIMWTREIPFIDPVAAAEAFSSLPGLAFLDSAMRHETLGRVSIVAADPFGRFRYANGRATLDGRPLEGSGLEALRACLAPYRMAGDEGFGFPGGAIGYFAYDLGACLERVTPPARRAGLTDDIAFNLYDTILSIDHDSRTCRLVANGFPELTDSARADRARARLDRFAELLAGGGGARTRAEAAPLAWRSNFTRASYEAAVETVRDYIRAGDIYQGQHRPALRGDAAAGIRSLLALSPPARDQPGDLRRLSVLRCPHHRVEQPRALHEAAGPGCGDPADQGYRAPGGGSRRGPGSGRGAPGQRQGAGREHHDRRSPAQRPLAHLRAAQRQGGRSCAGSNPTPRSITSSRW